MHANIPTKVGTLAIAMSQARVSEGVVLCLPVFPLANEKPARTIIKM